MDDYTLKSLQTSKTQPPCGVVYHSPCYDGSHATLDTRAVAVVCRNYTWNSDFVFEEIAVIAHGGLDLTHCKSKKTSNLILVRQDIDTDGDQYFPLDLLFAVCIFRKGRNGRLRCVQEFQHVFEVLRIVIVKLNGVLRCLLGNRVSRNLLLAVQLTVP